VIIIKTPNQIKGIRKSSQLAATVLEFTRKLIRPGVTTLELNDQAHQYILDHNAIPAPLNYDGFPKSICTSINNVVCHGIPSSKIVLQEGDIVNIDITTILDGYFGDVSATYPVGKIDKNAALLIERTKKSLDLAVNAVKPGKHLNECVGQVIEQYLSQFNYGIVRDLGGHGVGLKFHEEPFVFHYKTNQNDTVLKPGMIFTIEPMVNESSDWHVVLDGRDGWTIYTKDDSLSCQFEHTVLVTPTGSEILTKLQ
jgi:methionyl aminopeptidase